MSYNHSGQLAPQVYTAKLRKKTAQTKQKDGNVVDGGFSLFLRIQHPKSKTFPQKRPLSLKRRKTFPQHIIKSRKVGKFSSEREEAIQKK
jgi:hypothetical protein